MAIDPAAPVAERCVLCGENPYIESYTPAPNFLQMRGRYTVTGRAGDRMLDFSAPGAAETFRGQ